MASLPWRESYSTTVSKRSVVSDCADAQNAKCGSAMLLGVPFSALMIDVLNICSGCSGAVMRVV